MKIIENSKLGKLFSKETTYGEVRNVNYQKAKESIIMRIKSCIESSYDKHRVTISSISEWNQAMISAIDGKIIHLLTKVTIEKSKNTFRLKDEIITEELKMKHGKFVVITNDKAGSNVGFVCQRHYAQVLITLIT